MRGAAPLVLALSSLAFTAQVQAQAQLPQLLPEAMAAGTGRFTFLGFPVYQATLWVAPGFRRSTLGAAPVALELAYKRSFKGADIARRSLEEMQRVGGFDAAQAERWEAALRDLLPDVKPGDRLIGVHRPGVGAQFYQGARALGGIDDVDFSRRFFAIWLGPASSAPALRDALLAGTAP
jgi:hypothetical protein